MKKIIILIALTFAYFFPLNAQKKALENLFDQYQDTEGVTSIKIAKPMFNMLSKLNIGDSDLDQIRPLLGKIQGLKILVIEDNAGISKKVSKDILSKISNLNYTELMTVDNKEAKIKFLSSDAKDGILDDLLLNINSTGNTVLMMLDGKIAIDDVNRLINETQNQIDSKITSDIPTKSRTKENRNVDNFSSIRISQGMKVYFTQGPKQSLSIETDTDKLKYLKSEVKNGVLNLYIDTKGEKNITLNNIIVEITAPELNNLEISSAAQFFTNKVVNSEDLNIKASSAASINGDFRAKNVKIGISSAARSNLNIFAENIYHESSSAAKSTYAGETNQLQIITSSASTVNALTLRANRADVSASSGSTIKVNAVEDLNSRATSGSKVIYLQKPTNSNIANSSGGTTTIQK